MEQNSAARKNRSQLHFPWEQMHLPCRSNHTCEALHRCESIGDPSCKPLCQTSSRTRDTCGASCLKYKKGKEFRKCADTRQLLLARLESSESLIVGKRSGCFMIIMCLSVTSFYRKSQPVTLRHDVAHYLMSRTCTF